MFVDVVRRPGATVSIEFEGRKIAVREGLSVAAGLLEAGVTQFRYTPETGAPRSAFCMMGACFDCLVVIDGTANCQACMINVRDGMRISRQSGDGGDLAGTDVPDKGP